MAGWVSVLNMLPAVEKEEREGRVFRGTLTLKWAWGTYPVSSVQYSWGSSVPTYPLLMKVDWQQTLRCHLQTEPAHGWSTHLEPQLEGIPCFRG